MKRILWIAALFSVFAAHSQVIEPIKWSFSSTANGENAELTFKAVMEKGWHLYDTSLPGEGPVPTSFVFEDSTSFSFAGSLEKLTEPTEVYDKTFKMNLRYFSDTAVFRQKVVLKEGAQQVKGYIEFMGCDDEQCLPPSEAPFVFNFSNTPPASAVTGEAPALALPPTDSGNSLWLFILISLLAGLAAILTPCVFPMIPMTVSFFLRGSENRGKAIRSALFFGLSIVAIFTLLGALFSFGIFGPNVGSLLSTHWIPNLLFFILFFLFALSFFGLFEIVLPSSLVNKTDAKADQGGMIGAFFMALTTVIVSFSCTGPFIGALIIEAVQSGGMRPLIGMFFFGLAFATPFTLLAIFPSAMSKLPKSGGWMNVVKVVFAFILLAFGLKFLSNIDQVYGFGLIPREIYLAVWIVIFFLLGLYFLGKIKFSHDSDMSYLGVGRLFLSIVTFTFVLYLFTGLLGSPLKSVSALLPPPTESATPLAGAALPATSTPQLLCGPAKYGDKLHLPHGLSGYFDYVQGLACAKEQGKPIFLVFKGHACANCKKMENTVWADPEILRILSEKYVVVGLYTDDRTALPEAEWKSDAEGKLLKTLGKVNLNFQISKYNTNSIPFHVIIEPDGTEHQMAVTFDTAEFRDFILKGVD